MEHLSTRTTICPHAVEAIALKVYELNKEQEAEQGQGVSSYKVTILIGYRDISHNVTPFAIALAATFSCPKPCSPFPIVFEYSSLERLL
jgi:hypothetical protein